MKTLSPIFIALLIAIFASCATPGPAPLSYTPPQLLERPVGLGSDEEQQWVSQTYSDLNNQLALDPMKIKPRLRLAELFMMEARVTGEHGHYYPAALKVLNEALAHEPTDDERFLALSLQASVKLSLHEFSQALEIAKEAVALNPYNAQIYGAMVDAYVELGEYDKAVEMSDKMISIRPDLRSYSRVSYLREIHGQTEGAIEAMEMAVKSAYPGAEDWAWAMLTLGKLYENYESVDAAREVYSAILEVRKDYPFALAALGSLERKAYNLPAAREWLDKATALIPEVSFYEEIARLQLAHDEAEAAQQTIAEILEMLADDEAHGHKMGTAYAAVYLDLLNQPAKALAYAQEELDARPENIEVNLLMARVQQALGNKDLAKNHLIKAQKTGSRSPEIAQLAQELQLLAERK